MLNSFGLWQTLRSLPLLSSALLFTPVTITITTVTTITITTESALAQVDPSRRMEDLPAQPLPRANPSAPSPASPVPPSVAPSVAPRRGIGDRTPSNSTATVQSGYLLGAGDQIEITVFGYEEYNGPRTVLPDGSVTVPLAGSVMAAGKTADQFAAELTARLQPFLVDPYVTVSLALLRPITVNIAGEVYRPGPVQLQSLSTQEITNPQNEIQSPTLSVALTRAGGITQNADIRQVVVRRQQADGTVQPMTLNLWESIRSENGVPDLVLQDGDSIFIPRVAANDTTIDRRLVSQSSYAPSTVRVRVVGEVNAPGEVQVPPNSSISSAVAIAGGPTEDARLSEVAFVRMGETGEIEREMIDLRNLTDTYQIQDGDVVIVPKRGSSSFIDFAGRVLSPLGIFFNLF